MASRERIRVMQRDTAAARQSRREYRCRACGYGAIASGPPPACPMCSGLGWVGARRATGVPGRVNDL
jgi:rubrerythrin